MPYRNMPKEKWAQMERCVKKVMADGKEKKSAIAICYTALTKNKELDAALKEFKPIVPPNYRAAEKAITDAPNLRDKRAYNCLHCQSATPLVFQESETGAPTVELVCEKHEFATDRELVCDDFEYHPLAEVEAKDFSITKQADGRYRWLAVTASAYQDRDGEIIAQAALEADTTRMDATKEYGILDWWHTPIRLGTCDFSAMHGRLSIESGLFDDNAIGEAVARAAKELAASRTFYHPRDEPDAQGVYRHIQTFRRAILPRGKESNLLTMLAVSKENQMLTDKIKELKKLLGGNPEAETKVDALLEVAEQTDKAAEQAGLAFKEATDTPAPPKPDDNPAESEIDKRAQFVADMEPAEFDAHLKEAAVKAATEVLTPIVAELTAQIKAIVETQQATAKEANANTVKAFAEITAAQAALQKRLDALDGLTPRGYRPSQASDTALTEEQKKELKTPKPDEKTGFWGTIDGLAKTLTQNPPA